MSNQTEDRIQDHRELTSQELEAISGGWIGHFTAILVRNRSATAGKNDDDCGLSVGCNGA